MIRIRGLILIIFMLMMVSVATADELVVSKARVMNEAVGDYEDLLVLVGLKNPGNSDLEDVQIQFAVLETGDHSDSGFFDIDNDDRESRLFYVPVDHSIPGIYTLKITISNKDVRRVKYRYFEVR